MLVLCGETEAGKFAEGKIERTPDLDRDIYAPL